MNSGLELYKSFIDGLVKRKESVEAKRIIGEGYPDREEDRTFNQLLSTLTNEQKEVLAKFVQNVRVSGIHDTLAYINEMIDCDGLVLSQNNKKYPVDAFESMHYDFVCRCEGDEWPKTPIYQEDI